MDAKPGKPHGRSDTEANATRLSATPQRLLYLSDGAISTISHGFERGLKRYSNRRLLIGTRLSA